MTEADLELRLRRWLETDASTMHAPASLRARVLDLPAAPSPARSWWQRFATVPALSAGAVAIGVAAIVVSNLFFTLFDVPAGADGEPCSNRQIQGALDALRNAAGYRYVSHDQIRALDPDAAISFDNPQYIWTDTWTSEGAYLAPDRLRDVAVDVPGGFGGRGYREHLQIGGRTYQLQVLDGAETWVEIENWPGANSIQLYVTNELNNLGVGNPMSLEWRAIAVPDDLPGANGCSAAALLPQMPLPNDAVLAPGLILPERMIALRVDVSATRPMTVYLGPSTTQQARDGDARSTWEITWTTPSADEFVAPTDVIPDPNAPIEATPPPTPTPLPVDPNAWPPIQLPSEPGASLSDAVAGDRLVAVGGLYSGAEPTGLIWTSIDGRSWEPAGEPGAFEGTSFGTVAWDGSTYLAVGARSYEPPEGPQFASVYAEVWLSSDGLSWERGGGIGPDPASGEVASVGALIPAGPGWVASGSIWTLLEGQMRPAIFTSVDGERWSTVELAGVGSGSLSQLAVLPDGSLFATGCESPGRTNSGAFGEACYMRPWHSDDGGETWTVGANLDVELSGVVTWGDQLIAAGGDAVPPGQVTATPRKMLTSRDGSIWTELPGFAGGSANATGVTLLGDTLVVSGQIGGMELSPHAIAWRSVDGDDWEQISLGLLPGGSGSYLVGVVPTPSGLALLGTVLVGETTSVPVVWLEP